MSNSYFKFKQFTIHQDRCAMKVSTEACILGAWVQAENPNRILDIGTGTGLLALMLAQRFDCPIDAAEIDEKAAQQASENTENSPWSERVKVFNQDVKEYAKESLHKYDLIISNPPFFSNSLKSLSKSENLAKHETEYFDKVMFAGVLKELLSENGCAYVIYPETESVVFKAEAEKSRLFCRKSLIIRNKSNGPIFREVVRVSKEPCSVQSDELAIRENGVYSDKLTRLLKAYYLNY